jgi:alpha-L-fucosidase 2
MKALLIFTFLFCSFFAFSQTENLELWYKKPASAWTEALPLGNGRIGAMIYDDYSHENIQLNEESVWAGTKMNNNNPEANAHLGEIQQGQFIRYASSVSNRWEFWWYCGNC